MSWMALSLKPIKVLGEPTLQHKILSSSTFLKWSHDCTHDVTLSSDLKQLVVFSSMPGGCLVMRMTRSSLDASASPLRYSILLLLCVCFSLPFLEQPRVNRAGLLWICTGQVSPFLWNAPTFGRPTDSMALSHWTVLSVCLKCSPLLWRPKQQYTVFKDRTSWMKSLILWHMRQFFSTLVNVYIPYNGTDLCHRFSSQTPFSEQRNWQVCQGRPRSSDPPPVRW